MVRILANGDIVQDDDPRVRQSTQNRGTSSRPVRRRPFCGASPQDAARPGERSLLSDINQQLVNMGFLTWNLGNQVVEPVMSILLLLLLMMVGVRGLLLVGLIYVVSHLSQR
uniref:Family with sequence similarity 241 member B n=1 Tax=Podarcis muralis TaxID=64176 RepID=A0A670IX88_PODMU